MGEQLVYIAGLTVGAQIVFGDQVKADTYRRLDTLPDLVDLDQAFGQQVLPCTHYISLLCSFPAAMVSEIKLKCLPLCFGQKEIATWRIVLEALSVVCRAL